MPTVHYQLRSGEVITFHIYGHSGNPDHWNSVSGIYLFCSHNADGRYIPHYIGQTENFKDRIPQHERWPEAARYGARFVLATVIPDSVRRNWLERELIQTLQPALNVVHKGLGYGLFG